MRLKRQGTLAFYQMRVLSIVTNQERGYHFIRTRTKETLVSRSSRFRWGFRRCFYLEGRSALTRRVVFLWSMVMWWCGEERPGCDTTGCCS